MLTANEIFETLRGKIRTGELPPGEILPPVREMAEQLKVNRNTVASAYKKLVAAGVVVTQGRNGTTVRKHESFPEQEGASKNGVLKDVSSGNPEPTVLPAVSTLTPGIRTRPRNYGEPVINQELVAYAQRWFSQDISGPFRVNLTHGAVDAIERLVSGYLSSGEKVVVEDPCFLSSINMIRSLGYVPVGVPVDHEGLLPASLLVALREGAQVVIITPRAHNPTGCSLTPARAAEIKTVLADYPHVMVIIDDHFSHLSGVDFHPVLPAETQHWAVIRSVSKFLGPDLRMAFVASNAETAHRIELRLTSGMNWVSHIIQDMAARALLSPDINQKFKQASRYYTRRREWFRTELSHQGIDTVRPCDGLNIWLPLSKPAGDVAMQMKARGWLVRTGEAYSLGHEPNALRLTLSGLEKHEVISLAQDLAQVLKETGNRITGAGDDHVTCHHGFF